MTFACGCCRTPACSQPASGALEGEDAQIVADIRRYEQRISKAQLVHHRMSAEADCTVLGEH